MAIDGSGVTRAGLLRRGAGAAGIVAVGVPSLVLAQNGDRDVEVLNLLLAVEYAEVAFYAQALDGGALDGELREYAQTALEHEREHLSVLKSVLADAANAEPSYEFGDALGGADAFADAAGRLEDLAVAAYNGQAANVSPEAFAAAARIVSVEARHAAWVRTVAGKNPAPDATDAPLTAAEVRSGLEELGVRL